MSITRHCGSANNLDVFTILSNAIGNKFAINEYVNLKCPEAINITISKVNDRVVIFFADEKPTIYIQFLFKLSLPVEYIAITSDKYIFKCEKMFEISLERK